MNEIRLNIGCASRPLKGYINLDMSTKHEIQARYPDIVIPSDMDIFQYSIFDLPYQDATIDEIRCDSMLEHLSFKEEKTFLYEVKRVLKTHGKFIFSVPDFEQTVNDWLKAADDWKDFYRDDDEAIQSNHWFGTYSYGTENRWGYLMASIFGPQNSPGQFHKNAYTKNKIEKMMSVLGFNLEYVGSSLWKGNRDKMINVVAAKA